MKLAMIGLGKMGANMVRRLRRGGIEVIGFDRDSAVVAQLSKEDGMIAASSVSDAVVKLSAPRIVWLMLPSGDITEHQIRALAPMLSKGPIATLPTISRSTYPSGDVTSTRIAYPSRCSSRASRRAARCQEAWRNVLRKSTTL